MNVKLLERVAAVIQQRPENFDMSDWASESFVLDKVSPDALSRKCGTTACIAGWAVALHDGIVDFVHQYDTFINVPGDSTPVDIEEYAASILEIDKNQADSLFHDGLWPTDFYVAYFDAREEEHYSTAAQIAAERIAHFIQTNGKE